MLLVFSVMPNCALQNTQLNKLIPNFLSKQYLGENLGSLPEDYKYKNIYINLNTINSKKIKQEPLNFGTIPKQFLRGEF